MSGVKGSQTRADALPEAFDYKDDGCRLFSACLSCPLPRCQYETRKRRGGDPVERDALIRRLHLHMAAPDVAAAAAKFAAMFRNAENCQLTEPAGRPQ